MLLYVAKICKPTKENATKQIAHSYKVKLIKMYPLVKSLIDFEEFFESILSTYLKHVLQVLFITSQIHA